MPEVHLFLELLSNFLENVSFSTSVIILGSFVVVFNFWFLPYTGIVHAKML